MNTTKTTPYSIELIKHAITDALSEESITAQDLASAIREEISESVKYHRTQMEKAEKVLGLLDPVHDMSKFAKFDLFGTADDIYSPSDLIGNYRPQIGNYRTPYIPNNDTIKF
jgi:hypothetical protein